MKLKVFNTLGRLKEDFEPIDKNLVKIYSCGPTVYSTPHIGNLRAYIFASILGNVIKNILGYDVLHVVNITDVGHLTDDGDDGQDKLEKASLKENRSAYDIALHYENIFHDYLKQINVKFDIYPKATENIKEQIEFVSILEKKGYTYIIENDGVYMDTSKVKNYGKLLPQGHIDGILSCARVQNDSKKNKTDFALWKFSPINEKRQMERESPWGIGFPGWHIECSCMSYKYLGDNFDIHTGGVDHIPVHHTNEIAQSESVFDKQRVKYRMHNEHLNLKDGKMSKSLGNVIDLDTLRQDEVGPLAFKYFIYLSHYRNIQSFSLQDIKGVQNAYFKLKNKLSHFNLDNIPQFNLKDIKKIFETKSDNYDLIEYLLDDLDTVKLIAGINKILNKNKINKEDIALIKYIDDNILKLDLFKKEKLKITDEVQDLAKKRFEAKKNKNYELADKLREEILVLGYEIKDTKDAYEIVKK